MGWRAKKKVVHKMLKPDMLPAKIELGIALDTMRTNAPINERDGNKRQAALERSNAESYKAALGILRRA